MLKSRLNRTHLVACCSRIVLESCSNRNCNRPIRPIKRSFANGLIVIQCVASTTIYSSQLQLVVDCGRLVTCHWTCWCCPPPPPRMLSHIPVLSRDQRNRAKMAIPGQRPGLWSRGAHVEPQAGNTTGGCNCRPALRYGISTGPLSAAAGRSADIAGGRYI